jgi:dTDP-4-amino-4,6-dideoxygalactose transaminase
MSSDRNASKVRFDKEFTKQNPLPPEAVDRALELLQSGRLHRYNVTNPEESDAALLEKEFAAYTGSRFCLGVSSCGSSLYIALKAAEVQPGDLVLSNAFTLAPVPGAIHNAGAKPVFVECDNKLTIDIQDLERKAKSSRARYFLISYMRGHIPNMDRIMDICARYGLYLIEDCAHTMGARWRDTFTGRFGQIGCFSSQTYKHINSGEGGLLITDDEDIIARSILYSGSYMLYDKHISRPPLDVFEKYKKKIPNFSLRMSNLTGALLRPQLENLDSDVLKWNQRYRTIENELRNHPHIKLIERHEHEHFVGSSFQFLLTGLQSAMYEEFLNACSRRGVEIKWFGWSEPKGYTSKFDSWQFLDLADQLPKTHETLNATFDFRIPLSFTLDDCRQLGLIIRDVVDELT